MCNSCRVPTVEVTSFNATVNTITMYVGPFTGTTGCCGRFNVCIPFNLPAQDAGAQIQISDGTTVYPCVTCTGGALRLWQLLDTGRGMCSCNRQKKLLHCRLVTDSAQPSGGPIIQIRDCLPQPCNSSVQPISVASAQTEASAAAASKKAPA